MKVVHMTTAHAHTDTRIFLKYCCSLASQGFDCTLVGLGAPNVMSRGVQILGTGVKKTGRCHRMTIGAWSVYRIASGLKADIYHFHDPELIPVSLLLRLHGKKVVYDAHEDVPEDILLRRWIPRYLRKLISVVFRSFENWAARQFSGVIGATPAIRDRFLRDGAQAVAVRNYPIRDELLNSVGSWSEKEDAVCYIGGISPERGIFELIESMIDADAKLLLAGRLFYPKLGEQIEKAIGSERVENAGFVGREQIAVILKRSKAGMVTLHSTPKFVLSLPIKMFEYMSAGIPVIASNFPLWRDIVERFDCGLCVDPTDSKQIAETIRFIMNNPERAEQMGRNGQRAIAELYNWGNEFSEVLRFYSLIGGVEDPGLKLVE